MHRKIAEILVIKLDENETLTVALRQSMRANRLRLTVKSEIVEAVAPLDFPYEQVLAFINAKKEWLKDSLRLLRERSAATQAFAPPTYKDGVDIPFQGKQIPLKVETYSGTSARVKLSPDRRFIVYLPRKIGDSESNLIRHALGSYMKQKARQATMDYIERHSRRYNLYPSGLRIKTLKSRWGSCSSKNNINLNWLLMLGPPEILEYVVVHELCHIKHKNHSPEFWQLVQAHLPDYQTHRAWLKNNGSALIQGL